MRPASAAPDLRLTGGRLNGKGSGAHGNEKEYQDRILLSSPTGIVKFLGNVHPGKRLAPAIGEKSRATSHGLGMSDAQSGKKKERLGCLGVPI